MRTQGLVGGVFGLALMALAAMPAAAFSLGAGGDGFTIAPMLEKVTPAVVNIAVKSHTTIHNPLLQDPFFRQFFNMQDVPQQRVQMSAGSGVIIDAGRGLVVSNNHVVNGADEIMVTLKDRRRFRARLVGDDPATDIALLRIDADSLTALPIGDSEVLKVGDFVAAIGNPFGLGQTVTAGIVSALGRSGLKIEGYENFIQTDASINPGNSGGALVYLRGELVGINTAILAPNGGNVGIGFAIPSNMAGRIKTTLVEHGAVKRGQLGVSVQDVNAELAQAFGLKQTQGAVITAVQAKSPAAKAGLEPGDVVLAINDKPVKSSQDIRNTIGLLPLGEEVKLDILRGGETQTVKAEIAAPKIAVEEGQKIHPKLAGLLLRNASGSDAADGVLVEKIHSGAYAFQAGVRPGDVIVMANRQPVATLEDLKRAAGGGRELLLNIQRGEGAFILLLR